LNYRTLFGIFIALALLIAPTISGGEALAAVPNHDMQMMEAGHCQSPASHKTGHQGDMSCCKAMCVGVAVAHVAPAEATWVRPTPASIPLPALHRPFLGELATPPPRSA
jgi:hypothetical protein